MRQLFAILGHKKKTAACVPPSQKKKIMADLELPGTKI